MASQTPDIQAVLRRLEKVERQNRRLKRTGLVALVAVAAVALMGQAPTRNRAVEAQAFLLKDTAGKVRAELNFVEGEPVLALYDGLGVERAELGLNRFGSGLFLSDAHGKQVASLTAIPMQGTRFALLDGEHLRASLGVFSSQPSLTFYDAAGKEQAELAQGPDGSSLVVSDARGYYSALGTTGLLTPVTGETSKTSAASLVMFDKEGKVIWRAP